MMRRCSEERCKVSRNLRVCVYRKVSHRLSTSGLELGNPFGSESEADGRSSFGSWLTYQISRRSRRPFSHRLRMTLAIAELSHHHPQLPLSPNLLKVTCTTHRLPATPPPQVRSGTYHFNHPSSMLTRPRRVLGVRTRTGAFQTIRQSCDTIPRL